MPYDRSVDAGLPAASKSLKYVATGSTRAPCESRSWYGPQGSPVSSNRPTSGTTRRFKFRSGLPARSMLGT